MTTPEFREPSRPKNAPGTSKRNRRLTDEQAERRYAYLDLIDRRCDAYGRRCITAANVVIRAIPLSTGGEEGDEVELKSCTRHKRQFIATPDRYRPITVVDLPPGVPVTRSERNRLL